MSKHNHDVKRNIDIAFEMLKDEIHTLRVWAVTHMIPGSESLLCNPPLEGDHIVEISLTLEGRQRAVVGDDHINIISEEGDITKVPYDAVYCMVVDASMAKLMGWAIHAYTPDDPNYDANEPSVAYVNLETETHTLFFTEINNATVFEPA